MWKLQSVWGSRYRAGHGRTRVHTYTTGFTTASHGVESVDYAIRTYSGSGHLLQTLHAHDHRFDFKSGEGHAQEERDQSPVLARQGTYHREGRCG